MKNKYDIEITGDSEEHTGKVVIGGHDISKYVTRITVTAAAMDLPEVTITFSKTRSVRLRGVARVTTLADLAATSAFVDLDAGDIAAPLTSIIIKGKE